jgi:hypothetical protein
VFVTILKINFLFPYTTNYLVYTLKRPLGCQHYCKIFLPLINIAQHFSLDNSELFIVQYYIFSLESGRANMLSNTDVALWPLFGTVL